MNNKKQKDIEQVDFIAEVLQYSNIIFKKGTDLQKNEVLDLLFELAEEVEQNFKTNKHKCKIIQFPVIYKNIE